MGALDGRIALVIGGGQTPGASIGMGRASSLAFAREGATVVVADINEASASETVTMIATANGNAAAAAVDITDESSVIALISRIRVEFRALHVLQNTVGISVAAGDTTILDIDLDTYDRIQAINLRGMVAVCKHAIPLMIASGGGSIINIGSNALHTSYPNVTYKTSKAGVIALTRQLAWMFAKDGVRVNAIEPGYIDTPMAIEARLTKDGRSRQDLLDERARQVPLGRIGSSHDVANAALFFASDASAFITGETLIVDGGQTLKVG